MINYCLRETVQFFSIDQKGKDDVVEQDSNTAQRWQEIEELTSLVSGFTPQELIALKRFAATLYRQRIPLALEAPQGSDR